MGPAHGTAPQIPASFQREPQRVTKELRMDQPATGQSKTSTSLYYKVLMTVTICTNNREEVAASVINV